jgi:hypothetical protein
VLEVLGNGYFAVVNIFRESGLCLVSWKEEIHLSNYLDYQGERNLSEFVQRTNSNFNQPVLLSIGEKSSIPQVTPKYVLRLLDYSRDYGFLLIRRTILVAVRLN